MNQLMSLLILAAPSVNAMAAYMAQVPQQLQALVDSNDCILPEDFTISNFDAESEDGGQALDTFEFGFLDDKTDITTTCYFNSTSEPIIEGGRTPRYPCEDARVLFIWQNSQLTMIEKVCPGEDGTADYEAAGTAVIKVNCGSADADAKSCAAGCKAEDVTARFASLSPVPQNPSS